MSTSSLADTYQNSIGDLSSTDAAWVQFVRDHMNIIKQNQCYIVEIDAETMNAYRFRLSSILRKFNYDTNLLWLVMEINDLYGIIDVVDLTQLTLPNIKYITDLHNKYLTISANQLKN